MNVLAPPTSPPVALATPAPPPSEPAAFAVGDGDPPTRRRSVPHPLGAAALIGAIALAFADASIVALALPDLYVEFEASITAVSWVLIAYALAVAVAGFVSLPFLKRISPSLTTAFGAVVFAASSVAAGMAATLPILIGARTLQGIGAAALVAGSVRVLGTLVGDTRRAGRWWAAAGTAGAAIGPALGGAVTEIFDWRVVFLVQAPVALAAVVACAVAGRIPARTAAPEPRHRPRGAFTADTALALTFGALVGALFLGVILLVVVWGLNPLMGALVVSPLPLATVFAPRIARALTPASGAMTGALLLSGGLATLALLPALSEWWVAAALGACGLGFGVLSSVLGPIAVPHDSGLRAATVSSSVRHLGLVAGLAIIAPVLAADITTAAEQAPLPATAAVLDAPVSAVTKVRLALSIRDAVQDAPEGEMPDLDGTFTRYGSRTDPDVAQLQTDIENGIREVITRSFRPALGVAAGLAFAAGLVGLGAAALANPGSRRQPRPARRRALEVGVVALATAGAVALPLGAVRAGAADFGTVRPADPCTAPADPFPGGGFDAAAQRFAISGLNGAACELGVSREELVLSFDSRSGFNDVRWDRDTIEDALRSGVKRAIGDADDRNTLPGWIATALRWTVDRVPLSWFLERLGVG